MNCAYTDTHYVYLVVSCYTYNKHQSILIWYLFKYSLQSKIDARSL